MSLKAGGVGLNLTAASNVFLMVIPVQACLQLVIQNPLLHPNNVDCFLLKTGSMVESCSGGASNYENSSHWTEKGGSSNAVYSKGKNHEHAKAVVVLQ